jgi:transcriptional regulator with XRE-family HTH domain
LIRKVIKKESGVLMSTFGEKIKRLRNDKGMSTRMLGEKIGVSYGQISKYENGVHEPTLNVLNKYKEIFGASLDYLCDDEKE